MFLGLGCNWGPPTTYFQKMLFLGLLFPFLRRSFGGSVKFIEKTDHNSFGCFLIGFVIAIVTAGFF